MPVAAHHLAGEDRPTTYGRSDGRLSEPDPVSRTTFLRSAITAYESGQRRVPISTLPLLAHTLGVSLEYLIGVRCAAQRSASKRGPAPKPQLERITRLPKAQ